MKAPAQRALSVEDVTPGDFLGEDTSAIFDDFVAEHTESAAGGCLAKVFILDLFGQPASLFDDPIGQWRAALDDRSEQLAPRGLEHGSDVEKEEFAARSRNPHAFESILPVEQPILERQMMVLDELFTEHQPVVNVEMEQGAGRPIEPGIALEARDTTNLRSQHEDEAEPSNDRHEQVSLIGSHQEVEVGLPTHRGVKVLVALPMAVGDSVVIESREQRIGELQPVQRPLHAWIPRTARWKGTVVRRLNLTRAVLVVA
jgi:hypothetical protein